jgi:two-component system, OmpR family, sensor histidine kinase VicK
VISDVAGDYINQIKDSDGNVNLVYELDKKQAKEGKEQQQIPDHTILVEADKERIAQVISNLISNAIKFTKGGAISITTKIESSGKEIIVSIKDTVQGIDIELLPKLFSKFVSKSYQGTDLDCLFQKVL